LRHEDEKFEPEVSAHLGNRIGFELTCVVVGDDLELLSGVSSRSTSSSAILRCPRPRVGVVLPAARPLRPPLRRTPEAPPRAMVGLPLPFRWDALRVCFKP